MSVVVVVPLFIKNLKNLDKARCVLPSVIRRDCKPSSNSLGTNILEVGKLQSYHSHVQEYIQCYEGNGFRFFQ